MNKTTTLSYRLCIVSNGRYSELDLISHLFPLPGDLPNFRMYECFNHEHYEQIPLAMFNIEFDNFPHLIGRFPVYQRELHQSQLNDFHRSLQYMLLSYYIERIHIDDLYTPRIPGSPEPDWFDDEMHNILNHNIFQHGKWMDTEMEIWLYSPPNSAGVRQLVPIIQMSILVLRGGRVNPNGIDIVHEDREYPPVSPPDYSDSDDDDPPAAAAAPAEEEEEDHDDNISPIGELVEDDSSSSSDDDGIVEGLPGPARRGDEYLTFEGYELDTADRRERNDYFFHQAGVTQYLRNLVALGSFHENINDSMPPKTPRDRDRVQRYFHIPARFMDTFTNDWSMLSAFQFNRTRLKYYCLVIIHNGRYDNELDVITHMSPLPSDPNNLMIYAATNYDSTNDMQWCKFNISWNNFNLIDAEIFRTGFRQCYISDFSALHRAIQYMMLCYYVDMEGIQRPDDFRVLPMDVGWYDERKHESMEYNICHYAPCTMAQMAVTTNDRQEDGTYRDATHIERSEAHEDVFDNADDD